jgi:hypothetical protein
VATRPERRPRDQDRRRAARCRPVFTFGIGTKAVNRRTLIRRTDYLIFRPWFLHFTLNHYTSTARNLRPLDDKIQKVRRAQRSRQRIPPRSSRLTQRPGCTIHGVSVSFAGSQLHRLPFQRPMGLSQPLAGHRDFHPVGRHASSGRFAASDHPTTESPGFDHRHDQE